MSVLRILGNLLLAIVLLIVMAAILLGAYAIVISQVWENVGPEYGVETGAWVWIDGRPIYYRLAGAEADPCVLLIHGYSVEGSQTWNTNMEGLARAGVRVLAMDLLGFGHSARDPKADYTLGAQAALAAKVVEKLGIQQGTLVGHGWGSAVALRLAQDQPQWARGAVFISPRIYTQDVPLWRRVAHVRYLGRAAAWALSSGGPGWTALRRSDFQTAASRVYLEQMRQPSHIVGTLDALLAMDIALREEQPHPNAVAIKAPLLILLGREDKTAALQEGQRLAGEITGAKLITISEAGPYVHVEQNAQVNRAIAEFCLNAVQSSR